MPSVFEYITKDGKKTFGYIAEVGMNPNTGKRMQKKKRGFKTAKLALLAGAEVEKNALEGVFVINGNPTFEEVYKQWITLKKTTVKPSTFYQLESIFDNHILPRFRHMKIKDISIAYCQEQINELSDYKSVAIYKAETKAVFKYAMKIDLIVKNPMDFVELPRRTTRKKEKKKNFLEKDEVIKFLKHTKENYSFMHYTFFYLLFFTGMRKGEAMALKWDEINFGERTLTINNTITYAKGMGFYLDTTKGGTSRTIDIDTNAIKILKEWKLQQPTDKIYHDHDFVFTRLGGYPLRLAWANEIIKTITKNTEITQISVHGARHTHASLLFESGASIKDVQERLGHSDTKMTLDVYTHVTSYKRKETSDAFAEYMEMDL